MDIDYGLKGRRLAGGLVIISMSMVKEEVIYEDDS
jgi:hypothetical protein